METVDDSCYRRQTPRGEVVVRWDGAGLEVEGPDELRGRVERMFDSGHNPADAARVLGRCEVMRPRLAALAGLRVPGCWEPFELAVRVVVGQQVSVQAAHTMMGRVAELAPGFAPAALAEADLTSLGMPGRRKATLQALARAAAAGELFREGAGWPETAAGLATVPGIGPWTLGYLAIRLGRDADAFPASDLGLLRAAGVKAPRELERLAERWRPFRAYAAMYLWNVPAGG
jgi:DNA-3-methyladenine glycosylase II